MRFLYLIILLFICPAGSFAQASSLSCYVFDTDNLPAKATVILYNNQEIKGVQPTDEEGFAVIKPMPPGNYKLAIAFFQGDTCRINNVVLQLDKTAHVRVSTNFANKTLDFRQVVDKRYDQTKSMLQQDRDARLHYSDIRTRSIQLKSSARANNPIKGGLTGEVRDETGYQIPNVAIFILRDSAIIASMCCADMYGRYKLKDIPSEVYDIQIKAVPDRINSPSLYLPKTVKDFTIYANRYSVLNVILSEDTTVTKVPVTPADIVPFNPAPYLKRDGKR